MAREKGQLVFGGPFQLIQGGVGLVGRLPVYTKSAGGDSRFWGLVSVTLKYPDALAGAALDTLETQGFSYEIWRMNPDDGKRQTIASGQNPFDPGKGFIERSIHILNAEWFFRVAPVKAWYEYTENWIMIVSGFLMSLLVAVVTQTNTSLLLYKAEIDARLNRDSLTGLLNRNVLLETLESMVREGRPFSMRYVNIDEVGRLNDKFGYVVTDGILATFARRLRELVGNKGLVARMAGDEFAVIVPGPPDALKEMALWSKVLDGFTGPLCTVGGSRITLGFCDGLGVFPKDGKRLDAVFAAAYLNMRKAKASGREKSA